MHGNSVKKDGENGQLDCGIYCSPAALASFARLGQRSLDDKILLKKQQKERP